MSKMLIADDEKFMLDVLLRMMKKEGYEVFGAKDGAEGLEIASRVKPDLIITDLRMPETDGKEMIRVLREAGMNMPVIVMTAFGSIDEAVECLKLGANDFITKPFDLSLLLKRVNSLLEKAEKKEKPVKQKAKLIGESPAFINTMELAKKSAPSHIPVLLLGDTGTGKEVVAGYIHENSERSKKPFFAVNCVSIPHELIESEFFGYKKGAFTGAYEDKDGLFHAVDGGTLFIDEIGELPEDIQVKLLRFLENSKFSRVGDTKVIQADIRFIFATNKNLKTLVEKGRFRSDLYYRINIFPIYLPPLRERPEDIEILAKHFISSEKPAMKTSLDFIKMLNKHKWPGNIRELKHFIERAVLLDKDGILNEEDIPGDFFNGIMEKDISLNREIGNFNEIKTNIIRTFEYNYFTNLLDHTGWNINKASRLSGLSRKTIYQKIETLKIKKNVELT